MIRVPGVSPEQVRVHNVLQGRLTHVRIDFPVRNVDILHVYQHAASTDPSRTIKDKRRRLFNRLDTLIHSMPGRNLLVVGGDFNQPLPCALLYTGSAICVPSPTHPDHCREGNTLLHVAERHDLVALNTFHCRPSFTFQHCASRTQIDFIFVRSGDAFGRAKRSRPLYDSSLMAWRDTKHHPLIAELSLPRHWWPSRTRSIRYDRAALVQSYNLQTPQYQTFADATVRHFAATKLSSYDDMRDQLLVCCAEHFPATKLRVPQPWNHPSLSGFIQRMWAHYKSSRLYQRRESFDLPTCFAQWHHASRFQTMHREAKRHGRLVKRERYLNQIQQAEEAAASHNAFVLYRIVRRLAPKQRFQTVQIRSDDGLILSHDQEFGLLRSHFEKVWHKPPDWCCPILRSRSTLEADAAEPCIYAPDLAQLKCSASSMQPYKALPSTHPAAPAFKAVTEYFGDRVVDWMSGDGRPCMPQSWNLTHVALIPKPGKKHGAISSLRPIGLQDPIAKGYIKVLADDLKPYAMSYLRGKPQHAYLAHRSTYSAIIQAADHCRRARGLLRAHTHNLHQRREGTIKRGDFCACLQISVDLSQAFDTAPWELIHESLRRTRALPALINRIMDWISGTKYVLEHRGSKVEVRAQRGVRQGCVLSPLLWSLFRGLIYEEFQCLIDHDTVQPEVVFFADDKHLSWILDQPSQLVSALRQFGSFIQLLRTFGLQVNSTKSNAIMSLRGSMSQSLRKLWTSTFQGREWLRVPTGQANEFIPLVQQLDYLGIVLSYGSFEELSWKRRIGVARASFECIRKILLGHHVLSLPHRVKLWKTIVLPSATYGLLGIGWSSPGFTRLHGMCMKQLRMIARSPVHLTSGTNIHLLQRLGIQELGDHLIQMTTNALAYHQQLVEDLSSEDVMCRPVYVSWYRQLLQDLHTGRMMSPMDCEHLSPDLPSVHACEFCDQTFDDVRSLRRHQRYAYLCLLFV